MRSEEVIQGYVTMYICRIVEQKIGKYIFYSKTFIAVKISLLPEVINKDIFYPLCIANSNSPSVFGDLDVYR